MPRSHVLRTYPEYPVRISAAWIEPSEMIFDDRLGCNDTNLASSIESMESKSRGDHIGHLITVGRCARPCAVDVGRQVTQLIDVLIRHDRSSCGSGIRPQHHTVLYKSQTSRVKGIRSIGVISLCFENQTGEGRPRRSLRWLLDATSRQ